MQSLKNAYYKDHQQCGKIPIMLWKSEMLNCMYTVIIITT